MSDESSSSDLDSNSREDEQTLDNINPRPVLGFKKRMELKHKEDFEKFKKSVVQFGRDRAIQKYLGDKKEFVPNFKVIGDMTILQKEDEPTEEEQHLIEKDKLKKLKDYNNEHDVLEDIDNSNCCIINPEGWTNVVRENIMQVLIVYTITLQLFKISFIEDGVYFYWDFWDDLVVTGFFIIDIMLNFFTPFYKNHQLIITPCQIATNYMKTYFLLDVISVFPFEIFLSSTSQTADSISTLTKVPQMIKNFRTFKMMRVLRIGNTKNKTLFSKIMSYFNQKFALIQKIIPTMVSIWIIAHIFACFFYVISENSNDPKTWLYSQGYIHEAIFDQYISCYYFIFSTITTVGYGDIVPVTVSERIAGVLFQFMGVIIFSFIVGYLINEVFALHRNWNETFEEKISLLDNFLEGFEKEMTITQQKKKYVRNEQDIDIVKQMIEIVKDHRDNYIEPMPVPKWDYSAVQRKDVEKLQLEVCKSEHQFDQNIFFQKLPQDL